MDQGPKDQNKLAANHFKASTSYPLLGNPIGQMAVRLPKVLPVGGMLKLWTDGAKQFAKF